jgi:hypothetical protein
MGRVSPRITLMPEIRFPNSYALLQALLTHEPFASEDIDAVIASFGQEDQHLEYKAGAIMEKKPLEELRLEVRRHVTGFANAEGGVLFVGVSDEQPRKVTGARAPGTETLVGWGTRLLSDLAGYFSPMPNIFAVDHPAGQVLVIAAARAPQLVPFVEAGELRYTLRIGDSTLDVPPYLIADLMLGRRSHPVLELRDVTINGRLTDEEIDLSVEIQVDNDSLIAAVDTGVGRIAWSLYHTAAVPPPLPLSKFAQQYVELEEIGYAGELSENQQWLPQHRSAYLSTIRQFERQSGDLGAIALPRHPDSGLSSFAIYLAPLNSPPKLYAVECEYRAYPDRLSQQWKVSAKVSFMPASRPRVAWRSGK